MQVPYQNPVYRELRQLRELFDRRCSSSLVKEVMRDKKGPDRAGCVSLSPAFCAESSPLCGATSAALRRKFLGPLGYVRAASSTLISDRVAMISVRFKSAAASSPRYSSSVRSRPPVITSMLRSINL
jgi:hypothetical protein